MAKTQPPGPPVRLFGFLREMRRDPLAFFTNSASTYGDVVRIQYGIAGDLVLRRWGSAGFILNHPTDIKYVLVTNQHNYPKFPFPPSGQAIFGQGLLTSEEPLHLSQRRIMQPYFNHDRIATYAQIMIEKTERLLDHWQDGTTVDVAQEMSRLTLSIVLKTLFGENLEEYADELMDAVTIGQHHMEKRFYSPLGYFPIIENLPSHTNRRFREALKILEEVIQRLIRARMARQEHSDDLISTLLNLRDVEEGQMSHRQIRDEMLTLLLAGHETTSNALVWTWFLLAQNPGVEERLLIEIKSALGGRRLAAVDLPKLTYVGMVLSEAMRLYPPVWALQIRRTVHNDTLPSGVSISAGALIYIIPYVVHRDARFFSDPDRFDPQRFDPAAKHRYPDYAYFPFGGGSRRCIGEAFAWMEGILILATIAQRFKMSLPATQTIVPEPLVTLRPKNGIMMRLNKRRHS